MDENLALLSMEDLRELFDDVVYERKLLYRRIYKEGEIKGDKEILAEMNEWINKLDSEIAKRLRQAIAS